jgi:hypothetical protein
MHETWAPRGNCRGVLVGKLLRFRIDAGLTGIDQPEEACLDLRVDFSKDCIGGSILVSFLAPEKKH